MMQTKRPREVQHTLHIRSPRGSRSATTNVLKIVIALVCRRKHVACTTGEAPTMQFVHVHHVEKVLHLV